MPAQTPITGSLKDGVIGDIRYTIAKFTSVADGDTFVADMGTILGFSTETSTKTATMAGQWTNSSTAGATFTFNVNSGPASNVSLVLFGQ